MNYKFPSVLQNLIDNLKLLPGVGEKTAERYAFSMLNMSNEKLDEFSNNINNLKTKIKTCPNCGCLTDTNKCIICDDEMRDSKILCVVEHPKNVFIFQGLGFDKVKYHVLGGLISPIDGINPDDLNIALLEQRIEKENIKEVILALRSGIEGNTTSLYIKKILEKKDVKITQIAQGIPIGTDMEYLDGLTLELALANRNEIS